MKLPKGVDETFVQNLQSMSTDELKATVVRLQMQREEVQQVKESDAYKAAKDAFDLVAGPVRDTNTALKNKTKLVVDRLKEKGVKV